MRIFGFNGAQWREIFLGLTSGVNVSKYAKKRYSAGIMKELREGLEEGIDVTFYSGKRSVERVRLLKQATKLNIDISNFMGKDYSSYDLNGDFEIVIKASQNGININRLFEEGYDISQVLAICVAANNGILVMPYINPQMPHFFIKIIYKCLYANVDVSTIILVQDYEYFFNGMNYYCDYDKVIEWYKSGFNVDEYILKGFNLIRIEQIYLGWQEKIDTTKYADTRYDFSQMEEIRKGEETGVDTSIYANPNYSSEQMCIIREGLEAGIDVTHFANPEINITRMADIKNRLIDMKKNSQDVNPVVDDSHKPEI